MAQKIKRIKPKITISISANNLAFIKNRKGKVNVSRFIDDAVTEYIAQKKRKGVIGEMLN